MRLWRRWCISIVLLLVIVAGGAWLWRCARSAPSWYATLDPNDQAVIGLADTVEKRLLEEFHKIRPDEDPWTVRVREHQLNAWLAARLPEWIAHEEDLDWPRELGAPQIHVEEDGINLAVEVTLDDHAQVITTRLTPQIIDGHVYLTVDRVGVGRIALPGEGAEKLLELIERIAPDGVFDESVADRFLGMLSGNEEAAGSRISLSDGRLVELIEMHLSDGAIDLTGRTLSADP